MKRNKIQKFIISLIIFPTFIWGQTGGGGMVGGGVIGGGKADIVIKKQVTQVFNKKIFTGLGQKTVKKNSPSKITTAKKSQTKPQPSNAKRPSTATTAKNNPTENDQDILTFEWTGETGIDKELAEMISQNPVEQEQLLEIFKETKKAFDFESSKLGRENNIALATTFFIATCITVYHQTADPSETATEALYESLANEMLDSDETKQMSNEDKQLAFEKLVYFAGLILAGYIYSKENNDHQTLEAYRQIAATCFQEFTNLNVEDYKFTSTGLTTIR